MSQKSAAGSRKSLQKQEKDVRGSQGGWHQEGREVTLERNSGSRLPDFVQEFDLYPKEYGSHGKVVTEV